MPIPKLVITAALMAVQVGLSMTRKIEGPRLDNLSVSLADYGTPMPRLFGQRRLMGQIMWAADLREKKETSKTKGGKQTQYTYYGDWAVAICDQDGHDLTAFDEITKVWFDKQLVFDKTNHRMESIGPLFGDDAAIKLHQGHNYRIYKGTPDQMPDPMIEAWCEDKYGPDTCPAYRLTGYVAFQNIPLTYVGNRVPQVEVEVIRNPVPIYPFVTPENAGSIYSFGLSPSGNALVFLTGTRSYQLWDVPTMTMTAEYDDAVDIGSKIIAVNDDGSFYSGDNGHNRTVLIIDGVADPVGGSVGNIWNLSAGVFGASALFFSEIRIPTFDGLGTYSFDTIETTFYPNWMFEAEDQDTRSSWAVGGMPVGLSSYTNGIGLYDFANGIETVLSSVSTSGAVYGFDNGAGQLVLLQEGQLYLYDKAAQAIVLGPVAAITSGGANPPSRWAGIRPGDPDFWLGFTRYSSTDFSIIETVNPSDWGSGGTLATLYDFINDAIWGTNLSGDSATHVRFLHRVTSGGSTLKEVVDTVSRWCGVADQDTSQLTQIVQGYSVTQGSGKDMLSPLLDIYDSDAGNHDFDIKFVARGSGASGATLMTQNFAIPNKGDKRYVVKILQTSDLPLALTFNFADMTIDDQPNNVRAFRSNASVRTTQERTIDLSTFEVIPSGAQQKGDRCLGTQRNERERTTLALTYQEIAVEPADVRTLSLDGHARPVRLDKLTIRKNHIECEWLRDEAAVAVLNGATGPNLDGNVPDTIIITPPTKGFVFDMPNLSDSEDSIKPLLHVAGGAYNDDAAWPGAVVYDGSDGTFDTELATISASEEVHWGVCQDALATANSNLWDRGNTLTVRMSVGTLSSVTEAQVNADPSLNLIYVGQELIQFASASLNGDGTYTLSDFKRGRRGTEWAVGLHAEGEKMVVASRLLPTELALDDIGDAKAYKVQTYGRGAGLISAINMTFSGASLKPWAPARVKWYFDGTDLQGTITRRTRIGGNWNGSTIAMVESLEKYEIDIYNGSTFKRTITVSGGAEFTYTAAMAAADGISLPTPPTIKAYQISATVGRGFELAS